MASTIPFQKGEFRSELNKKLGEYYIPKNVKEKLMHSYLRRYEFYEDAGASTKIPNQLIRNDKNKEGVLLYGLLNDANKEQMTSVLTTPAVRNAIINEQLDDTPLSQLFLVPDFNSILETIVDENGGDELFREAVVRKIENYKDILHDALAKDIDDFLNQSEYTEYWKWLNDVKYWSLLKDGISEERAREELTKMQNDINKTGNRKLDVMKRTLDHRGDCTEPFYWSPETHPGSEIYKGFRNNICSGVELEEDVLLPLTFVGDLSGTPEKRQLVLYGFSFDMPEYKKQITCSPEYFIMTTQTRYSNYHGTPVSPDIKIVYDETQINLMAWSLIYNYLLVQCALDPRKRISENNKFPVFPVRILMSQDVIKRDHFVYFDNISARFIGIFTVKVPQKTELGIKYYTVFLYLFYKNRQILIYDQDGNAVDVLNSLYKPIRPVIWREIYWMRQHGYHFYKWLANKNGDESGNYDVILGSLLDKESIINEYRLAGLTDVAMNPDEYFREINIKSGENTLFEIHGGGGGKKTPDTIRKKINAIHRDKVLLDRIYKHSYLNMIVAETVKRPEKYAVKKYSYMKGDLKVEKQFHQILDKLSSESIAKNNELFQFVMEIYYWTMAHKQFVHGTRIDNNAKIVVVTKNQRLNLLYKYFVKVFGIIGCKITTFVPIWEFQGSKITKEQNSYTNVIKISEPDMINDIGDIVDFIHLEVFKKELSGERDAKLMYESGLNMLIKLLPTLKKDGDLLFITDNSIVLDKTFLSLLYALTKMFGSYEIVSLADVGLYPHFWNFFQMRFSEYNVKNGVKFMEKLKNGKIKPTKKFEKLLSDHLLREYTANLEITEQLKLKVESGIDDRDQRLHDAYLFCQKWGIPVKPWVPGKFLRDDYGVYLFSRMFSFDQNIVFPVKTSAKHKNVNVNPVDFDRVYADLMHKFDLVGLPIEYVEGDIWYMINRTYRWYEKTLAKHLLDRYGLNVSGRPVSRAWLKMYEILSIFKLGSDQGAGVINTFHICEAPGNMIMAIGYYITHNLGKKQNWVAQSLVESDIGNDYGLIKKNPNKWDMGPRGTGDITDLRNILHYRDRYYPKKIDWISCDCGHEFAKQDETTQLHFAELLTMMVVLRDGGSFVSKLYFPIKDQVLIRVLSVVCGQFNEAFFYKSYQNPWNTEVYLIGKGYRRDQRVLDMMLEAYKGAGANSASWLPEVSTSFKMQLLNFSSQLYAIFSSSIDRNLYYVDHIDELKDVNQQMLKDLIVERNEDWDKMFIIERNKYKK